MTKGSPRGGIGVTLELNWQPWRTFDRILN